MSLNSLKKTAFDEMLTQRRARFKMASTEVLAGSVRADLNFAEARAKQLKKGGAVDANQLAALFTEPRVGLKEATARAIAEAILEETIGAD